MFKKLAILAVLAYSPFAASASQLPEYPFIHVSASASANVVPDIGELDFEILAADPDPAAARAAVEARIAEIQGLMEQQGAPLDDVEVRDLRQAIRKGEASATAPIYEIKCAVHLNVHDLTKWRAIAGGLLAKPNLDGFSTSFGATARDKIEMELTAEALRDARRRADAMAAGVGRKVGAVTAVTNGALKNLSSAMGLVQADFYNRRNSTEANRVEPGDIVNITSLKFVQSVDVIFRIK
ncbi:MAG: SIMPL domain-containing protein [Massilia sp.]